ncbi:putative nucleotidyltransferase [Deinococcus sp. HSC-46F16]|uniref:nucleotidyltransferase family protein n=1 Tax=Deinococcus sp. HSC-46F16 TaxID=2910968 RepID=UPI00209DBEEE|nr:nucleotidyltransferase domain-containing protein [Deinococcus sp. HSC-46F16]MCP2015926.1 putative nucleotidyltransferase [Deinococcus sp. HSC-46F16]
MAASPTFPSGPRLEHLRDLARAHRVRRLDLFGSVARGAADAHDYDFLVEFEPLPPLEHGRAYLSLLAALQDTLAAPVDLIEAEALDNPYFEARVRRERVNLYAR